MPRDLSASAEGGAGIAGLTKLVAVLRVRSMPANLHLRELNDHVHEDQMASAAIARSVPVAAEFCSACVVASEH